MPTAKGPFEVKLTPEPAGKGIAHGRLRLDKSFHGDLEATSTGEMLAVRDMELGSGVYVAMERVSGRLAGRAGAFSLAHMGVMDRGQQSLRLIVVPDSGDGELKGLTGEMRILITGGDHAYELDYEIA